MRTIMIQPQCGITKALGTKVLLLLLANQLGENHIVDRTAFWEKFHFQPFENAVVDVDLADAKLVRYGCSCF